MLMKLAAAQYNLTKKQEKNLEKLKINQAKQLVQKLLLLSVGCIVMVRCNTDVTVGLVNGAIGTVMGIYATRISIKFDHIDVPCDIERVTSRFMLSKNLYIHRKQFCLILFYAITIHKCQGLSLDTAIIDLLTDVFGDGMALSRVRILNGLHLLSFDRLAVKKSNKKDDVLFTCEEPSNPDIVRRQWDYVHYPAARILSGSPTPLSDERVPKSTLEVPGDGNCLPFHISIRGQLLSISNYVKQLLVICQTLKKNCLIVH
uniref:ATP-dependent DNA helicase n=1 Tax=Amphimedon queenslandica TaxID=400682 RepID=A0A1X7TBG6_AMPQE